MSVERLSDRAIEIIDDLHTERLDYTSEYLPLIDAANKLDAYEDTGLEPEEIEQLKGEVFGLKVDKQELEKYRAIGPIDRLRELVEADLAGRVKILSSTTGMTCGACDHFKRIPGTCRGRCSERPYCRNKYGHTDERLGEFMPAQSRIACKMFDRRKGPEMPDISGMSEEAQKLFRDILSGDVLKGDRNG